MGFGFLKKLLGGGDDSQSPKPSAQNTSKQDRTSRLAPLRTPSRHQPRTEPAALGVPNKPYVLARRNTRAGVFLDGRVGEDLERLQRFGLPRLQTPEEIAAWLKIPLKTLAWMADYHGNNAHEKVLKKQHYVYRWKPKRDGKSFRLIEAPKPMLKMIQVRILTEIAGKVPPHQAAHGFTVNRSILSNARLHTGKYVILKADLEDFYPSIRFKRVKSVFHGLGYGLEASRWLAMLCTNRLPFQPEFPPGRKYVPYEYASISRHLPQGAPTSPALANLAAWALDVRLTGLSKKFGVTYTRYADDMTFSGEETLMKGKSMTMLIRYVRGIVKDEGFRWNNKKKSVVRRGSRQVVTGLTVNQKPNVSREEFDRLKAILNNCAKKGPAGQNHANVPHFRAHLLGRIGFVRSVNPQKAERLQRVFENIVW